MTDKDISKLRGVVKEELKPVTKRLDALWEQTGKLTEDMTEVKDTLRSHSAALKRIELKVTNSTENIQKLDKRLTTVESKTGIAAPPELTISQ